LSKDWGEVDATGGFEDKKKISDVLPIVDKNDFKKKYKLYRFIGGVQPYQEIWLPIFKDGKPVISAKGGKPVRIPKYVTNYNLETHKVDDSLPACPYVEVAEKMNKHLSEDDQLRVKQSYLACVIDREAQENPPKKIVPATKAELKAGFYDMESPSTKMTAVFDMTPSLFRKIKGLKGLNKVKFKKTGETKEYQVTDPKYGCDVNIKFDPSEKGGAMYDAQKGERTAITEEEEEYPLWDISSIITPDDYKTAKKEADRLWKEFAKSIKGGKGLDDDDDDLPPDLEDEDEKPSKKKAKKPADDDDDDEPVVSKKKKKPVVDDDDEDEDLPVKKSKKKPAEDDDDDDDDTPVKKGKKKVVDDDEDEDPDVDLDDDEPVSKKKKAKKTVDDDEDDDDDTPVKKGKKKAIVDDDDDEDDTPVKKKAKKKPADDDDDDLEGLDDDDDSSDDDDDDEPVVKKSAKKKKVVDDDDDDED
jgi:hypothetical protein